jgi:hypothetical protein
MAAKLSALCADRPLPPGRFLVLISVRDWVEPRVIVRLEGLDQTKKKSTYLIGNQTREPPACSIVLQTNYATACPLFQQSMKFIGVHVPPNQNRSIKLFQWSIWTLSAGDDMLHISNVIALQTCEIYTQSILAIAGSETEGQTTQFTPRISFSGLHTCSALWTIYSHAVAVHNVVKSHNPRILTS